jgi:hypothetical protein
MYSYTSRKKLPFRSLYSPFFGALIYLWLAGFCQQIVFEKQLLKFKEIFERIEHAFLTQAIVTI